MGLFVMVARRNAEDICSASLGRRRYPPALWVVGSVFLFAAGVVVAPNFPPVMDYPNHLARLWLLAGGAQVAPMTEMYSVDWSMASTNIGVDWVASKLMRIMSLPMVDRLLRLSMFLGPAVTTALFNRVVHGRWLTWQIAGCLFAWGTTSIAGFMSYTIGIAAAVFAATAIYLIQRRSHRWILPLSALMSAALFFIHPFAVFFYLALACGIQLGPVAPWRIPAGERRQRELGIVLLIATTAAVIALLLALSPQPPSTGFLFFDRFQLLSSLKTLLSPALSYDMPVDIAIVILFATQIVFVLFTGGFRFHTGLTAVAMVLALLALVAPNSVGDASWVSRRLPLMAALAGVVAAAPKNDRPTSIASILLTLLVLFRVGWIAWVWGSSDVALSDMLVVTRTVPSGQGVLIARQQALNPKSATIGRYLVGGIKSVEPMLQHLPVLLVPLRQLFIPTLFSVPGQHPIRFAGMHQADQLLDVPILGELRGRYIRGKAPINWRCRFRYLLVIGANEPAANDFPSGISQIARQGAFALYGIDKPQQRHSCSAQGV